MDNHILTKEELKILRQADTLVYRNNKITCIQEETNRLKEVRTEIPITSNYTDQNICAYVKFCSKTDLPTVTVLHNLKAGDQISLHFYKDAGTNDLLRKSGLHCDRLFLNVYRDKKLYQYCIGSEISLDNSVRMIQ